MSRRSRFDPPPRAELNDSRGTSVASTPRSTSVAGRRSVNRTLSNRSLTTPTSHFEPDIIDKNDTIGSHHDRYRQQRGSVQQPQRTPSEQGPRSTTSEGSGRGRVSMRSTLNQQKQHLSVLQDRHGSAFAASPTPGFSNALTSRSIREDGTPRAHPADIVRNTRGSILERSRIRATSSVASSEEVIEKIRRRAETRREENGGIELVDLAAARRTQEEEADMRNLEKLAKSKLNTLELQSGWWLHSNYFHVMNFTGLMLLVMCGVGFAANWEMYELRTTTVPVDNTTTNQAASCGPIVFRDDDITPLDWLAVGCLYHRADVSKMNTIAMYVMFAVFGLIPAMVFAYWSIKVYRKERLDNGFVAMGQEESGVERDRLNEQFTVGVRKTIVQVPKAKLMWENWTQDMNPNIKESEGTPARSGTHQQNGSRGSRPLDDSVNTSQQSGSRNGRQRRSDRGVSTRSGRFEKPTTPTSRAMGQNGKYDERSPRGGSIMSDSSVEDIVGIRRDLKTSNKRMSYDAETGQRLAGNARIIDAALGNEEYPDSPRRDSSALVEDLEILSTSSDSETTVSTTESDAPLSTPDPNLSHHSGPRSFRDLEAASDGRKLIMVESAPIRRTFHIIWIVIALAGVIYAERIVYDLAEFQPPDRYLYWLLVIVIDRLSYPITQLFIPFLRFEGFILDRTRQHWQDTQWFRVGHAAAALTIGWLDEFIDNQWPAGSLDFDVEVTRYTVYLYTFTWWITVMEMLTLCLVGLRYGAFGDLEKWALEKSELTGYPGAPPTYRVLLVVFTTSLCGGLLNPAIPFIGALCLAFLFLVEYLFMRAGIRSFKGANEDMLLPKLTLWAGLLANGIHWVTLWNESFDDKFFIPLVIESGCFILSSVGVTIYLHKKCKTPQHDAGRSWERVVGGIAVRMNEKELHDLAQEETKTPVFQFSVSFKKAIEA
eukprot:GFYU01002274.1.p1 GENE.GFYU01002274.1~~GFYU01002274.1.p1  ORF type:complete len:940 (+),score=183.39 GFYU01002274.1:210-3029(+)